jgi:LysM repeat protein
VPVSRIRTTLASAAVASAALVPMPAPARASAPHAVQPGETLWSIAAAYNFTTRTVAVFNGLSEEAPVYAGGTIQIPTEAEGAAALASAGVGSASTGSSSASGSGLTTAGGPPPPSPPYWTAPIYCPCGEVYLASNAAAAWEAMRQESLELYGIDLYPDGTLSGYRSYAQQLYLYNLYLSGQGSLAAVPGTSSHEYGIALDLAEPYMRTVVDQIGGSYGWAKTEAPGEWWHINYVGP